MIQVRPLKEPEIIGMFKEYYCDSKFIGVAMIKENDHSGFGYDHRQHHTADETFKVGKKKIKKGSTYMTVVFPLCGRIKE